jgi:hypothetical protein
LSVVSPLNALCVAYVAETVESMLVAVCEIALFAEVRVAA